MISLFRDVNNKETNEYSVAEEGTTGIRLTCSA